MAPTGRPSSLLLAFSAVGLFLIWSNSFIAMSYLLGGDRAVARFDWVSLTVARFLPAALLCGGYSFLLHRREALATLRRHWRRLVPGALMAVPGYNLALNYGQEHGVPAPIASLTTALLPLFVMVMAVMVLGERLTRRRLVGFGIGVAGMILVAIARRSSGASYGVVILITALAPLAWSVYTVISKPIMTKVRPLLWTYLAITCGGLMILPLLPYAWGSLATLDLPGWLALAYLTLPCTVLGFAIWTWLLEYLPASTVGLTVFFNPPLTTLSKLVLAAVVPATFAFTVAPLEIGGGLVVLGGLVVATGVRGRAR